MRSGEATKLKWIDIDEERRIITLNAPEKTWQPQMWKVSAKLNNMLNALPKKIELVFGNPNTRVMRSVFCGMRKGVAEKLQNPCLVRISFQTFRHWKTTSIPSNKEHITGQRIPRPRKPRQHVAIHSSGAGDLRPQQRRRVHSASHK